MACANLFKKGVPKNNITMVDRTGVIYVGRKNLNQWKFAHAIETSNRCLDDAIKDADVFLGLSAKGALTKKMVKKMKKNPIILLVLILTQKLHQKKLSKFEMMP